MENNYQNNTSGLGSNPIPSTSANNSALKSPLMIGIIVVLLVVVIVGASAFYMQSVNSSKNTNNSVTPTPTPTTQITLTPTIEITDTPTASPTTEPTVVVTATSTPTPTTESTTSKTFVLGKGSEEFFPSHTVTLNGIKSSEVLTGKMSTAVNGNPIEYNLKSADFTMSFIFRYEDFAHQYKSVVTVVPSGSNQLHRAILKADTSNTWVYVNTYVKTGTCPYVDEEFLAPCGPSTLTKGTGGAQVTVRANNTNGLKRADEIVKAMTINKN